MFFYLCKVLFSGFLQFNGNFVDAQNNSEYRDWAPLNTQQSSELHIISVSEADIGKYSCLTAIGSLQVFSREAELSLKGKKIVKQGWDPQRLYSPIFSISSNNCEES